jgi:hypothetical protein
MALINQKIIKLSKQLLPTGRAFRGAMESNWHKLFTALAKTESQAYIDVTGIRYSLIPDNANFDADDATEWERRLGLISNVSLSLPVRSAPILRKMAAPGRNPAKCQYQWIEKQLQDAGFPVYVYENVPLSNPATHNPAILSPSRHGGISVHGMHSHYINHVVINSLDNNKDVIMSYDLNCAFYIGGNPLGTMASIPAARELEFRQLILQLKKVSKIAILYVQYI